MFLRCGRFPEEEEQFEAYRKLVGIFGDRPVTIRTLDLGGDKKLGKYFDKNEKNPFMGCRAIRFCLENRELFKTQLRALLRAGLFGNLRIMFPMISGAGELTEAVGILEEAKRELEGRGMAFKKDIPVCSMIEVPSAALTLDLIAEHCSFVSIGTNDLIQYLLACDRVNDRIAYLYEPSHPAVVRCLKQIVADAHGHKIDLSLCGEVAGDGLYLPMLLGLGLRNLSLNYRGIPEIKHLARGLDTRDCKKLVDDFLKHPKQDLLEVLRPKYAHVAQG
jgi:phosphotransferase system enzyme I (PtsI)